MASKSMRPGGGGRFRKLVKGLKAKRGKTRTGKSRRVRTPGALAAWIGRRKYGAKKFQAMATAGRRRRSR